MFWNKTKMTDNNTDYRPIGGCSANPELADLPAESSPTSEHYVKEEYCAPVIADERCYYKVGADSVGNVHLSVGADYSIVLKMNAEAVKQLIKLLTAALPDPDS
jgi:hypothetical protein